MEHEVDVYMDIGQATVLAGRLWMRGRQQRETATFKYAGSWLKRPGSFPLAPNLMLTPGAHQSPNGLFAAFTDPAPDKWGQKLMRHYEREQAAAEGREVKKLFEADFLIRVSDETRLGALRFKYPDTEEFLSQTGKSVPVLVDLRKLLGAAERIEKGKERKGDLGLLLAPGGSLGGARPKAVVRDKGGRLLMAKFPWKQDEWPVILWEKVTLDLAKEAGVDVPDYRLEQVGLQPVLLTSRFDRSPGNGRIHYLSLLTALNAVDHDDSRSYLEIVDALRQFGSEPEKDIRQMWRRMVFNVLVSNTDDHVRNHGFLVTPEGWRLAPAFDMNPCPADIGGRIHKLALNEDDNSGSLDLALSVAPYFGLKKGEATAIAAEVGAAVSKWRKVAAAHKIEKHAIERLQSAFDHQDLKKAISLRVTVPVSRDVKMPAKKRKASENAARKGA
jgi:serine/threonine-protein kinase HipA